MSNNETPIKYYELVFTRLDNPQETSSMCVLGYRKPSIAEAKLFWQEDCELYGDEELTEIHEITPEEAHLAFDMENEANFPIFGINNVYKKGSNVPLTPQELADAANAITTSRPFTAADFTGPKSRIVGAGHCNCGGNGKFELLPLNHPDVQEGGKRYMICRICGGVSHL